jgi:16S rRNA (cytosine967-C5)-methyltransferase
MSNSRQVAAEIIANWLKNEKEFPDRQMADVIENRGFITEVVYGTIRRYLTLQFLLEQCVEKMPKPEIEALLYVGIYQLIYMDVETYAAVNETVEAAPASARSFVNAILRRVDREEEQLFRKLDKAPIHIQASVPKVIFDRWMERYKRNDTLELCALINTPPDTIVRVNRMAIAPDLFAKHCKEAGIHVEKEATRESGIFYRLPRGVAVPKVPGFEHGWFTVQDPATATAIEMLAPKPGEKILDACAAPGGKTVAIASLMDDEGELVAMDIHDDRIAQLEQTLERMGFPWIEVRQADASERPPVEERDEFDAILLDVPCMNTGVFRRRVDARWRFSEERMLKLAETQFKILDACACRLKPGGRIVYSTCSMEPEENEQLVKNWVDSTMDFELVKMKKVFPLKSGTDGAFAAVLVRDSYEG